MSLLFFTIHSHRCQWSGEKDIVNWLFAYNTTLLVHDLGKMVICQLDIYVLACMWTDESDNWNNLDPREISFESLWALHADTSCEVANYEIFYKTLTRNIFSVHLSSRRLRCACVTYLND